MRNRKLLMKAASGAMAFVMAASVAPITVLAEEAGEWREENGNRYWYEDGVRQGYDPENPNYRGKEIYDPASDAWYWLDNVDQGKMATGKDVYQESLAGEWGDIAGENGERYGKWVRYDENGHMIKGWSTNQDGTYYFDLTYGTMAKGETVIDGIPCIFDSATGIGVNQQWVEKDGVKYWYEGGKRQGYDPNNADYRGKEIYDPASDAWYWLDNVDQGKMAAGKDVYQESLAGEWGDIAGENGERYGKWVRYDENGHMIKGWSTNENGKYYFDPIYGTMAKGNATIDGVTYYFDENTGVCQGEADTKTYYIWQREKTANYTGDKVDTETSYVYDDEGNTLSYTYKSDTYESTTIYDSQRRITETVSVSTYSSTPYYNRDVYQYDGNNSEESKKVHYIKHSEEEDWTLDQTFVYTFNAKGDILTQKVYDGAEKDTNLYAGYEYKYNEQNQRTEYIDYSYKNGVATTTFKTYYEYDGNGNQTKVTRYKGTTTQKEVEEIYTYDGNGNKTKYVYNGYYDGKVIYGYSTEYEYDANGNCIKQIGYDINGEKTDWTESSYRKSEYGNYYFTVTNIKYGADGVVTSGYENIYDENGNVVRCNYYGKKKELERYVVYDALVFPEPKAGVTYKATDYIYDMSNREIGKTVAEWKCFAYSL